MKRKVTLSLDIEQFNDLQALMKEDGQTNFTFYAVYLINQEKKARNKPKAGRPKAVEEEVLYYPSPQKGNKTPYTKQDLEAYYAFRNVEMPPLPEPLPKED